MEESLQEVGRLMRFTEAQDHGHMLSVIQAFPELQRSMERAAAKALPRLPHDAALTEFPRETVRALCLLALCLSQGPPQKKRVEAVAKAKAAVDALGVKDVMVWELAQGKKSTESRLREEQDLTREYSQEMVQWLELTDRLSSEVHCWSFSCLIQT